MRTEVHDLTIWSGEQSLHGELIDHRHVPKLRARIRRNAYDFQSHALVEAWTIEQGWREVHSVPITNLAICDYSYSYGNYRDEDYPNTENGKAGMPIWTDVMEADLDQLMTYGKEFFA